MNNEIKGKKEIDLLERKLVELIKTYELFFRGQERIEPTSLKNEVKRLITKLYSIKISSAMIKMKIANLIGRFNTYQRKWDNIWAQIEKGTYQRDRYKMNLHKKMRNKDITETKEAVDPSDLAYQKLHKQYETARKLVGGHQPVNFDKMVEKLEVQRQKLKSKYECKDIGFKVVVKDGKPTIRPVVIT